MYLSEVRVSHLLVSLSLFLFSFFSSSYSATEEDSCYPIKTVKVFVETIEVNVPSTKGPLLEFDLWGKSDSERYKNNAHARSTNSLNAYFKTELEKGLTNYHYDVVYNEDDADYTFNLDFVPNSDQESGILQFSYIDNNCLKKNGSRECYSEKFALLHITSQYETGIIEQLLDYFKLFTGFVWEIQVERRDKICKAKRVLGGKVENSKYMITDNIPFSEHSGFTLITRVTMTGTQKHGDIVKVNLEIGSSIALHPAHIVIQVASERNLILFEDNDEYGVSISSDSINIPKGESKFEMNFKMFLKNPYDVGAITGLKIVILDDYGKKLSNELERLISCSI